MESRNNWQRERSSAPGWAGRVSGHLGRARLLNYAFANHFLSLFSGGSTPRPPELTSESGASRCLSSWDPASPAPWPEGWVSVYGEEGWTLVSLDGGVPQALQPPGLSLGPSPSNRHSSPHSTSSSCERGALPRDLHRLRQDRHEWGSLEKLGSRGPRGTPEVQRETLGGG